jgi:hypothetical protein
LRYNRNKENNAAGQVIWKLFVKVLKCVINAGNARSGSVIHDPEFFNALKKLGAIRESFFFARIRKGQKPQSGMPYANASFLYSVNHGVKAVPQTGFLPICVNFCRLILINMGWQRLS